MESMLNNWVNTNYVPTRDEIDILKGELAEPNRKMRHLEDEITKYRNVLSKLKKERDELERYVNAHKALLSPARRLLPDILQEIFYHCLPTGRNPAMSRREAPVLLGRICRQWRCIALTMPRLWASIHISVPSDDAFTTVHTCSHAMRMRAITEWLSRSGACPLSISFSAPFLPGFESHSSEADTCQLYLDVITPFITKCKSLYLSIYRNPTWASFLEKYSGDEFPLLERLHFNGGRYLSDDSVTSAMKECGFPKGPRLRSLSLIIYGSEALRLPVRWEQLTELNLSEPDASWEPWKALSVGDALTLLSWCPNLEFCSIALSDAAVLSNFPGSRILLQVSLPNLTGLAIQSDIDPRTFFTYLSAPTLLYFQYHQEPPPSADAQLDGSERALHRALGPFIQKVIHPVEELQFLVTYLTMADVVKCLELFSGLKRLSLLGAGSPSFDHLFYPPHGGFEIINRLSIGDIFLQQLTPLTTPRGIITDSNNDDISDDEALISPLESDDEFGSNHCLCPQLEAFHCEGVDFADTTMLKFLHSRSSSSSSRERSGAAHLRWVNIFFPFGRRETPGTLERLDELRKETGMLISASYSTVDGSTFFGGRSRRYSPYDGLEQTGQDEQEFSAYSPGFGPLTPSQE